jgi:hypothetical protein
MKNYTLSEEQITDKSNHCVNCCHCYIPSDFLMKLTPVETYCNISKDKPLSGDILSEPFNYYDSEVYFAQEEKWEKWSKSHMVQYNGICDSFERAKS